MKQIHKKLSENKATIIEINKYQIIFIKSLCVKQLIF